MEIEYKPSFSLDEMAAQIALLKDRVGVGETPLVEDDTVKELRTAARRRVARAGTRVSTGKRGLDEEIELVEAVVEQHEVEKWPLVDTSLRIFDQGGGAYEVIRGLLSQVGESHIEMFEEDYDARFDYRLERWKYWMAEHPKERLSLQYGIPGVVTAIGAIALANADGVSSRYMEQLPTGGVLGVGLLTLGSVAIALTKRSAPRKAGEFLGRVINTSPKTYMPKGSVLKGEGNIPLTEDELPRKYAEHHLERPLHAAAYYLLNYDIDSRDDIEPMVDGLLEITEASLYESYGVDPGVIEKSWYRRMAHKALTS